MDKGSNPNYMQETQEEINAQLHDYEKKIEEIEAKIEKYKNDIDQKMKLYKDILDLDNTKEKYVLNYLLSVKEIDENGGGNKIKFSTELEKYKICISDEKYNLYFSKKQRKNARKKFLDFFAEIKKFCPEDKSSKGDIIRYFQNISLENNKIDFHNNKKVTWENEELYLNCLYNSMISSIISLIIYYQKKMECDKNLLNDKEYIYWNELLKKAKEEKMEGDEQEKEKKIKEIYFFIINIVLLNSTFYKYNTFFKKFFSENKKKLFYEI